MLLHYLIEDLKKEVIGDSKIKISGLECDASKIKKEFVFFVTNIETVEKDIEEAKKMGAIAIVIDKKIKLKEQKDLVIVKVNNIEEAMAHMANEYYDRPVNELKIIGITGSKGKTTTAYMIKEILKASGKKADVIENSKEKSLKLKKTFANSLDLYKKIRDVADEKVEYLILELKSEFLANNSLNNIKFEIAIFTNLLPECILNYDSMDEYLKSKCKIFDNASFAVINADDIYCFKVAKKIKCKIAKFGLDNASNITATDIRVNNNNSEFKMYINKRLETIRINMPGRHSVYDALAAITVTSMLGSQMEDILVGLASCVVPLKNEIINIEKSFAVMLDDTEKVIDLEILFLNIKKYIKGRIISIISVPAKLEEKTQELINLSCKNADFTIISSNDFKKDISSSVKNEIKNNLKGIKGMYQIIPKRESAISFGMKIAWKNDTIIISGKKDVKTNIYEKEFIFQNAKNMPQKDSIKMN